MSRNYEQDPEWFHEPENHSDYGPPGMPTPFVPLDPRIASRQKGISTDLRRLISKELLPSFLNQHLMNMLELNFDSFNTILGESNNDSYSRWKTDDSDCRLTPELQRIEERGVLGLASQSEIRDLLLQTDGFISAEFFRLFHPLKFRMRHLTHLRDTTNEMILSAGGMLADNTDDTQYYGLKIFPYVVETRTELSDEQQREIDLLRSSIFKKWEALHAYINENQKKIKPAPDGSISDEMFNSVSDAIDADEARILEIQESTHKQTVEGLMASIKRHVGHIPKSNEKCISVAERQLFAIDFDAFRSDKNLEDMNDFQAAIHGVRIGSKKQSKEEAESVLRLKDEIEGHFMSDSGLIIPVSTTAYGFESPVRPVVHTSASAAMASMAITRTSRLRN
jgi:hypothetical protein